MNPRSGRRALLILLPILVFAVLVPSIVEWWSQPVAIFQGRQQWGDALDFSVFYSAGKLAAEGKGELIYDVDTLGPIERRSAPQIPENRVLPYLNPPFFAGIFVPISRLSFVQAYQAWTAVSVLLLAGIAWLTWRTLDPASPASRAFFLLGVASLYPTTIVFRQAQFTFILAASLASTYLLLRTRRDGLAGTALLPMLIKPELAAPIVLFLLWKQRWKTVVAFTSGGIALALVSTVIAGPGWVFEYPRYVLEIASRDGYGTNTSRFFGWNGIMGAYLGPGFATFVTLLSVPIALFAFSKVAKVWRGVWDPEGRAFPYQWGALVLATTLADPHLYVHDVIVAVPAVAAMLAASGMNLRWAALSLAGWCLLNLEFKPQDQLGLNLASGLLVLMLVASVHEVMRARSGEVVPEESGAAAVPVAA